MQSTDIKIQLIVDICIINAISEDLVYGSYKFICTGEFSSSNIVSGLCVTYESYWWHTFNNDFRPARTLASHKRSRCYRKGHTALDLPVDRFCLIFWRCSLYAVCSEASSRKQFFSLALNGGQTFLLTWRRPSNDWHHQSSFLTELYGAFLRFSSIIVSCMMSLSQIIQEFLVTSVSA